MFCKLEIRLSQLHCVYRFIRLCSARFSGTRLFPIFKTRKTTRLSLQVNLHECGLTQGQHPKRQPELRLIHLRSGAPNTPSLQTYYADYVNKPIIFSIDAIGGGIKAFYFSFFLSKTTHPTRLYKIVISKILLFSGLANRHSR
jgi:hypothetical protein